MAITASIDISAEQRRLVLDLIHQHLPNTPIWAFGSRVKWTTRSNSDLDLVAFATPQQAPQISALKEAFEESNLPFRVDLLVWDKLPENFHRNIQEGYVVLVAGEGVEIGGINMLNSDPSEYVTIPNGWDCKKLSDCTLDGSISYGIVQPGFHDTHGVPVIRINNINNGQLDLSDVLKVSPEIEKKYERTRLNGGEVLLTLVGSTGQSFVAPKELKGWNVPRAIAVIRPNEEIGANWINICLQSRETKHFLDVRANTTVQKTLNLKDVRDIPILIPPQKDKEFIERTSLSISDKIQLNRQTNQTLEQIAQAIFKSWFVDFEPVKAKMAALNSLSPRERAGVRAQELAEQAAICAISGKTPEQLAQLDPQTLQQLKTTAALFPDALVDSELGEIPEGWKAKPLGNYLEIKRGGSPRPINEYMVEKGLPWTKIADATAEPSPFLFRTKEFIKEEGLKKTVLLKKGTLILTNSATPGLPKFLELDACIHDGWLHFPKKKLFTDNYLYQLFLDIRKALVAKGNGSVFTNLKTDILRNQVVVIPSQDLIIKFEDTIQLIFMQLKENCKEINVLTELRDSLLPKLLSGEIALPNQDEAA